MVIFLCDCWHLGQTIKEIALIEARAYLSKDQSIRLWAASHGGVYVPVSENTPPNPYLANVPERDIRTPRGRELTLMNPAYMIRQIMRDYDDRHHVRGHITSLKYFHSETAPDEWERAALVVFETGCPEVRQFTSIRGRSFLRIMTPLITEVRCLKCHAAQGYKAGDIRGGVSLSLPMKPYLDQRVEETAAHAVSFGVLWLLGGAMFWIVSSKLTRVIRKHDETANSLRIADTNNRSFLENALTGIYISQDGTIKFANAKFAEIHGHNLQALPGMSSENLIHPQDRDFVARLHKDIMEGRDLPEEYEVRCITRDGRTIWVQRRNTMIIFEGRPAVLGNEIDITQKKLAEEELKASECQLKQLVAELVQTQEVERKSIALEIHEEIAQSLSVIKMRIEASLAAGANGCASYSEDMLPIIEHVKQTIDLIRRLTRRLSPIMLDNLGIKASMRALCRESSETGKGNQIITHLDVDEQLISGDLKLVVYRTLEELLPLAACTGCDDYRTVSLDENRGKITLVVRWVGLEAGRKTIKPDWNMRMAMVKSRAESYGGSLTVEPIENQHTVTVQWPLPETAMKQD